MFDVFLWIKQEKEEGVRIQQAILCLRGKNIELGQYMGDQEVLQKKGGNSLAGELSKVRNNVLFLQHIALKEILEWIKWIQHEKIQ